MKQRHHLSMWLAIAPLLLFSACTRPYAGEEARKALCAHNLSQIGRALSQYREENGSFPPPVIMDHDLGIQYSWRIALLPYVEEAALFSDYRFDEPWNSKANQAVTREMPRVYRCPSNYNEPDMHTNYSMVVTTTGHDTNGRDETARRSRVVIVEVANAGIHWAEPCDVELNEFCPQIDGPNAVSIGSHHPNGAHILYADGSVEFLEFWGQSLNSDLRVDWGGYNQGMARPPRIEFAGAVYHVTSRGNARQDIFGHPAGKVADALGYRSPSSVTLAVARVELGNDELNRTTTRLRRALD